MRILFVLPDFPYPASTGGRLKVFNILKFINAHHQCDILCFGSVSDDGIRAFEATLPGVKILGLYRPLSGMLKYFAILRSMLSLKPPSFASYLNKKFVNDLDVAISSGVYDVVHYDIINMAQFADRRNRVATVHSPNDATSAIYLMYAQGVSIGLSKIRFLLSAFLMRKFERERYKDFTKIHVVSLEDAAYLKCADCSLDISVIPIALDVSDATDSWSKLPCNTPLTAGFTIACTGNLSNYAIVDGVDIFLSEVFPIISELIPGAQFILLGQNVPQALAVKASEMAGVKVISWVDNYNQFLAMADVFLVPDTAGPPGIKTRALQAMGMGVPVVGTPTAFAGIPIRVGIDGLVYGSSSECVEMFKQLHLDREMRDGIGRNGRALVLKEFSLNSVGPRYESMYMEAIGKFHRDHSGGTECL